MSDDHEMGASEKLQVLSRLLDSKILSRSNSICRILKFIVQKSVTGLAEDINEYSIATDALGRRKNFDPRTDNIVRVQIQRLRQKLEEFYSSEGAGDPVQLMLPRGHYVPEFHVRSNELHSGASTGVHLDHLQRQRMTQFHKALESGRRWEPAMLLLIIVIMIGTHLVRDPRSNTQGLISRAQLPSPLAPLWRPFLSPSVPLLIIYSNPAYLTDGHGNLVRYHSSSRNTFPSGFRIPSLSQLSPPQVILRSAQQLSYFDGYTGTGEVVAAARIAELLTKQHQRFSIQRSHLVSYEQVRGSNVIFIGGAIEDPILKQLPVESDLVLGCTGHLELCDHDPPVGKPDVYQVKRDEKTGALEGEYAVISLLPSVVPGHSIMILGGLTTLGTEAAAEFATSQQQMAHLEKMIAALHHKITRPISFQALLKVADRDGVPAKVQCLFVRPVLGGRQRATIDGHLKTGQRN